MTDPEPSHRQRSRQSDALAEALDVARNLVAALEEAQSPYEWERNPQPDPVNVGIAEAYVKALADGANAAQARAAATAWQLSHGVVEFDVDATVEHLASVAEAIGSARGA